MSHRASSFRLPATPEIHRRSRHNRLPRARRRPCPRRFLDDRGRREGDSRSAPAHKAARAPEYCRRNSADTSCSAGDARAWAQRTPCAPEPPDSGAPSGTRTRRRHVRPRSRPSRACSGRRNKHDCRHPRWMSSRRSRRFRKKFQIIPSWRTASARRMAGCRRHPSACPSAFRPRAEIWRGVRCPSNASGPCRATVPVRAQ